MDGLFELRSGDTDIHYSVINNDNSLVFIIYVDTLHDLGRELVLLILWEQLYALLISDML